MNLQYYISSKVKNFNLNVTEVLDSAWKKSFGIFNFTVGILNPDGDGPNFRGRKYHKILPKYGLFTYVNWYIFDFV